MAFGDDETDQALDHFWMLMRDQREGDFHREPLRTIARG
jgi:hypothetical protein